MESRKGKVTSQARCRLWGRAGCRAEQRGLSSFWALACPPPQCRGWTDLSQCARWATSCTVAHMQVSAVIFSCLATFITLAKVVSMTSNSSLSPHPLASSAFHVLSSKHNNFSKCGRAGQRSQHVAALSFALHCFSMVATGMDRNLLSCLEVHCSLLVATVHQGRSGSCEKSWQTPAGQNFKGSEGSRTAGIP